MYSVYVKANIQCVWYIYTGSTYILGICTVRVTVLLWTASPREKHYPRIKTAYCMTNVANQCD